jgi:hypothetical protein
LTRKPLVCERSLVIVFCVFCDVNRQALPVCYVDTTLVLFLRFWLGLQAARWLLREHTFKMHNPGEHSATHTVSDRCKNDTHEEMTVFLTVLILFILRKFISINYLMAKSQSGRHHFTVSSSVKTSQSPPSSLESGFFIVFSG